MSSVYHSGRVRHTPEARQAVQDDALTGTGVRAALSPGRCSSSRRGSPTRYRTRELMAGAVSRIVSGWALTSAPMSPKRSLVPERQISTSSLTREMRSR